MPPLNFLFWPSGLLPGCVCRAGREKQSQWKIKRNKMKQNPSTKMRKVKHYTIQITHLLEFIKTWRKITVISTFWGSLLGQALDVWGAHSLLYKLLACLCSHLVKEFVKNGHFWWHLWKTSKYLPETLPMRQRALVLLHHRSCPWNLWLRKTLCSPCVIRPLKSVPHELAYTGMSQVSENKDTFTRTFSQCIEWNDWQAQCLGSYFPLQEY